MFWKDDWLSVCNVNIYECVTQKLSITVCVHITLSQFSFAMTSE